VKNKEGHIREESPFKLVRYQFKPQEQFSVDSPVDLVHANGFKKPTDVEAELNSWSDDEVLRLSADLFRFLDGTSEEKAEASLLQFLASSSARGDSGCVHYPCRTAKLNRVSRYAALYAQKVYLPLPLSHPDACDGPDEARSRLESVIPTILHFAPLIRANIVRPIVTSMHYCDRCAQRNFARYNEGWLAIREQANQHRAEFSFQYKEWVESEAGIVGALERTGPEKYIDHGKMYRLFNRRPEWLPGRRRFDSPYEIPRARAKKAGLVEDIFLEIAADVLFHQSSRTRLNATFLTDSLGEAEFFETLNRKDDAGVKVASLCAALTHELPIFTDISIEDVLRIRAEIPLAFEAYRAELTKVVYEYVSKAPSLTGREVQDIYHDLIAPAVAGLRNTAEVEHRKRIRKSVLIGAAAVGIISLGAANILTPAQLGMMLGGAAGMKLLDQVTDSQSTSAVATNNFYFLYRVDELRAKKKRS
jgi:hypothetical protein